MSSTSHQTGSHEYEFISNATEVPQTKRFRFKAKSRSPRDRPPNAHSKPQPSSSHDAHRHHSSHRRRKRRKTNATVVDDASACDDSIHSLPPETAFRESLFDAMADDEGATFWEGVYGQPIHNYSKSYVDEQTGELEQMGDEEYARYVRQKMWEKSWEGIEAEREERRKTQRVKERSGREENRKGLENSSLQDGLRFDLEVKESLRRGQERRDRKHWRTLWNDYLQRWASLQQLIDDRSKESTATERLFLWNVIAWPVESGKREDLLPARIENFMLNGTKHANPDLDQDSTLLDTLKVERVRWHPDKIQQRFGNLGIDEKTMKAVTAVFQVIDRMWAERREQK